MRISIIGNVIVQCRLKIYFIRLLYIGIAYYHIKITKKFFNIISSYRLRLIQKREK